MMLQHWARRAAIAAVMVLAPAAVLAGFRFDAIEGGSIDLDSFAGRPVLVVNTASLCAFSGKFDDLQALHERYGPRGLVVLAVPSDDFDQELATGAEVREFCAMNFDLTLPMTEITEVTGPEAHPFYAWLAREHGFIPRWNFNKVLIGPEGQVVATWGAMTNPASRAILSKIEPLLN